MLYGELTVFCFKQKTAYEMRISDWSSDVCSSDLFYLADFPMWFEVKPDETDGSEQDVFKKLCKETKTPGIIAYGSPSPRQCNLLRVSDEGKIIGKYM